MRERLTTRARPPATSAGLLSVAFGIDYIIAFCDPFYLPPSVVTTLVVFAFLLLLSALSPKEEVDIDGEPSPRRRYVEPVLAVIEKCGPRSCPSSSTVRR